MHVTEHFPEIADGLTATFNYDPPGDPMSAIGHATDEIQVGFGAGGRDRTIVAFNVDIGGQQDVRLVLSPEQTEDLAGALKAAAIEFEN